MNHRPIYLLLLLLLVTEIIFPPTRKDSVPEPVMHSQQFIRLSKLYGFRSISHGNSKGEYVVTAGNRLYLKLFLVSPYAHGATPLAEDYYGPGRKDSDIMINDADIDLIQWADSNWVMVNTREYDADGWHCHGICIIDVRSNNRICNFDHVTAHYVYRHTSDRVGSIYLENVTPGNPYRMERWDIATNTKHVITNDYGRDYMHPSWTKDGLVWLMSPAPATGSLLVEFVNPDGTVWDTGSTYDDITTDTDGNLYGISMSFGIPGIWSITPNQERLIAAAPDGRYWGFGTDEGYFMAADLDGGYLICRTGTCSKRSVNRFYDPMAVMRFSDGTFLIVRDREYDRLLTIPLND